MRRLGTSALTPQSTMVVIMVFVLALSATLLAYDLTRTNEAAASEREFTRQLDRIERIIADRMKAYEQVLKSGAGLFAVNPTLDRQAWRQFVATLKMRETIPGARGLYFAPVVTAEQLATHEAEVRAEGFTNYRVYPAGKRARYVPTAWPEPLDDRALTIMGYDMLSEKVRRAALLKAGDSGLPTVSAKVTLAADQKAARSVPGFLYYQAVYAPDPAPGTDSARQAMLKGYVFIPFRMPDLFKGLFDLEQDAPIIELYDGTHPSPESLLYSATGTTHAPAADMGHAHTQERTISVGDHVWTLNAKLSPAFASHADGAAPRLLLFFGLILTLAVTGLTLRLLRAEATAQSESLHDGLTGLHNRRYLEASLAREEAHARRAKQPVSLIQFDLDHFKQLNDTFGHGAGDLVLRKVAEVLRDGTRGDDIACRYGGEEFTIILPGAELGTATARAEALRADVARLALRHGRRVLPRITISGGVSCFPAHGPTLHDVLDKADTALILAKREGRNRIKVAEATTTLN